MPSIYWLSWRSLRSSITRTLLSVLAVSFGVAATTAGSTIAQSLQKALLASDDMRTIMTGLVGQFDTMMAFVGSVMMLVVGFLIFNAFAMSITQRRQQIGALRALGATRGQVLRLMLAEALVIALVGTALGFLLGPLLSSGMIALIRQFGGGLLAFEESEPAAASALLAAVLGVGVPLLAMLVPARGAARISPLSALRQPDAAGIEPDSRLWAWVGTLLVVGLLLHLVIAPPGTWVGYPEDGQLAALFVVVWVIGLALLLPAMIGITGRLALRALASTGAAGRLIGDNLRRGRARVTFTILTMAFGLTVITGLSGFIDFGISRLFAPTIGLGVEQGHLFVSRLDITSGWEGMTRSGLDAVLLTSEEAEAIRAVVGSRAATATTYFVVVPELSFLGDAFYSTVADPDALARFGTTAFTFKEGSWETALPVMRAGCGVLVAPLVARKNNAGLGDTITVTGAQGPVACTIAGIGITTAGASIISAAAGDSFNLTQPVMVQVLPARVADLKAIESDLEALKTRFPALSVTLIEAMLRVQEEGTSVLIAAFNGLLLLAVLAAALSVVNTMMISVRERQREIGLLRAVGATRAQTRAIIMGEAALMGVIGGLFGLVAGLGVVAVFVLTYGGNSFGLTFPLWPTALEAMQPPLLTGVIGLLIAPVISALAAWLAARPILQQNTITAVTGN